MEMSRKKRRRRRLLLIVPLLVLTGLVLLVELHLSPYIRELARNQAVNAASNAIIEAVSEMLRRGDTDFSRVIVLENGRVAEEGSFDALLSRGGVFAAMYQNRAKDDCGGARDVVS